MIDMDTFVAKLRESAKELEELKALAKKNSTLSKSEIEEEITYLNGEIAGLSSAFYTAFNPTNDPKLHRPSRWCDLVIAGKKKHTEKFTLKKWYAWLDRQA